MKHVKIILPEMTVQEFRGSVQQNLTKSIRNDEIDADDFIDEGFPKFNAEWINKFVKDVTEAHPLDKLIPNCIVLNGEGGWVIFEGHAEYVLKQNFEKCGIILDMS